MSGRAAQEAVLAAGGLATLVRLASSPAAELRINAAWALQNLMHHASADVRAAVLAALPWERVEALAADADARVQARAASCSILMLCSSWWRILLMSASHAHCCHRC